MFMLEDTKYKGIEVETISKEVDLEDRTDNELERTVFVYSILKKQQLKRD